MPHHLYAALGLGAGLWIFYQGFKALKLKRIITGLATSKIRSLAMGTVELFGKAASLKPLSDPIYERPCVYYQIDVKEERGSGKRKRWVHVYHTDSAQHPFLLVDETGAAFVSAVGAEVHLEKDVDAKTGFFDKLFSSADEATLKFAMSVPGRTRDRLHVEAYIVREVEPMYVLGYAVPADQPLTLMEQAVHKVKQSLQDIARRLKSDPLRMKTLDKNKDGTVDAEEWDEGLLALKSEMENPSSPLQKTTVSALIRKSPEGLLILADKSEKDLVRDLGLQAPFQIFLGAAIAIGCAYYLLPYIYGFLGQAAS